MKLSDFEEKVNIEINKAGGLSSLKKGYASFCKHFFVENFTETQSNVLEVTKENENLLRTGYKNRTEKELPVLERWFDKSEVGHLLQKSKYLDCILYSREQITKENEATGDEIQETDIPWGIVSIKPQDVDYELPMNPITQMRNSLGKEEGGSGVSIDKKSYMKSVEYWSKYAVVL